MLPCVSDEFRYFNHLSAEIEAAYHGAARRLGLSDCDMLVLYALYENGGERPLREVVPLAGGRKQTVNSSLRRLEADGRLTLLPSPGRGKTVRLTDAGLELAERTVRPLMELENEIFSSWSERERALYIDLTRRYLTDFRAGLENL